MKKIGKMGYIFVLNRDDFPENLQDHIAIRPTGMSRTFSDEIIEIIYEDTFFRSGDIVEVIMDDFPTETHKNYVTLEYNPIAAKITVVKIKMKPIKRAMA